MPSADTKDAKPGPRSPQAQPRGDGRIELPKLPTSAAPGGVADIPGTALDAYKNAEKAVTAAHPGCRLPWELVAGIGRVESVHATGYGLRKDGTTKKPIRGPRLDGKKFALIRDTDDGRWDGDTEYDRAVGPMQFIPSTWKKWGADGNGDSERTPANIYDAALGTGLYLCADDRDLSTAGDLDKAVLSYNQSREYVDAVLGWMRTYQGGVHEIPDPPAANIDGDDSGDGGTDERDSTSTGTSPKTPSVPNPGDSEPHPHNTPRGPGKPSIIPGPSQPGPKPSEPAVSRLEQIGPTALEAQAGEVFDVQPRTRAVTSNGRAAPGEWVTYEIVGKTSARFPNSATRVSVATDHRGIATPPRLAAGNRTGSFTVRATLGTLPAITFHATVQPRPAPVADKLTRTADTPPRAPAGGVFTEPITVKATSAGRPVAGTTITATLPPDETGPYFTGENGLPTRTLTLDPTGTNGRVTLPALHAGTRPGTYTLSLTTPEAATLHVDLTVTAAQQ